MDRRLLNGNPKCTVIQRFNHSVVIIKPDLQKEQFKTLKLAKKYLEENNYEVSIAHLHPGQAENI